MPRKRKRKPPGPPVMICVDRLTFKRFLAAVCDLSAALQDAHSTVTLLHELLVTKRRQSDAAQKAWETRRENEATHAAHYDSSPARLGRDGSLSVDPGEGLEGGGA